VADLAQLEAPQLREHQGLIVVRDDLIEGGTKVRVAPHLLESNDEWVFAGPAQGYAQLALAIACEQTGKRAVFFTAKRRELLPLTLQSMRHGMRVVQVPYGRISHVQAKARAYCAASGASFIELGLKLPGMEDALVALAGTLAIPEPEEIWVTAGSGTLARALARAWPSATINAVQIGMRPHLPEGARLFVAPERFEESASGAEPPFPSAEFYDRKMWRFVQAFAHPGALVWNVGR
jgi:hypothetical protein